MQNHLIQMLSLVAMEPPISLDAEDIRDEKVKLLRAIPPVRLEDLVIGQYGDQILPDGSIGEPKYTDDPTVPNDSITPTFACAALRINTPRWSGTPFILKCGKAIDSRKAEIRIQFKLPANVLFGNDYSPNELVLRVQPDEAVYLKLTTKQPGLEAGLRHTELDLSYKRRFTEAAHLPDAYERLIYDVLRGDHNLFVRADELAAAWKIFTPVLHELEEKRIKPPIYKYGGRGPPEADEMIKRLGYIRTTK
jgi:glucose-6-phosphate 1-dehydrogenase